MIKYGLISHCDAAVIEKTISLAPNCSDKFCAEPICITEIGLYNCETSIGIYEYVKSKNWKIKYTGIDNQKDKEIVAPDWMNLIIGNSNEVYNQLEDESQHMIFFDGDHSLIGVISDFFAYEDKIKVGGYAIFHDTGEHIKPFKDFQHGDENNPDAYISVRKAIKKIGLRGWEPIFDEADIYNEAGGVMVFKKLF